MDKEIVIKALQENLGNIKQTAQAIGIDFNVLRNYCRYHKLDCVLEKPRIEYSKLQELYQEHGSLKKVAKILGVSGEGVRLAMKAHGMIVAEKVIHTIDHSFFSEDTEQALYWAGFIAADGSVKTQLSIGLSVKDKNHLQRFVDQVGWSGKIGEYLVHTKGKASTKAEIKITSAQILKDLSSRFNIVPNKTFIYTFPERLISSENVHHFIRGYFDGDGSFYVPKQKKPTKQVFFSLLGTEGFTETCAKIISEKCCIEKHKPRKTQNIFTIEYGGNKLISKIRDFLYQDATVFLERKHDVVKDVEIVERFEVTPELLISKMRELGEQKKVANFIGCSAPSITRYVKMFGIEKDMRKAKFQFSASPA